MVQLVSPGVSVTVIDESINAPAGPGTVPLIFIATQSYKNTPDDAAIATGTLPENAGKLWTITSQRELLQIFGNPFFYSVQGTPIQGYELNEYGLLAAYQYLGIANRANILRADINTKELFPTPFEPRDEAKSGTYWYDLSTTEFGVFESNGNPSAGLAFKNKRPHIIDRVNETETLVLGSQPYDNNNSVVISSSGTYYLDINGVRLTFTHDGNVSDNITLEDIVNEINLVSIPDITASIFRLSGFSWIQIKNRKGGTVNIQNTSSNVLLSLLGLQNYTSLLTPKVSIGVEGDVAVVTINNDNLIYQKIIPKSKIGLSDPSSSPAWFLIGSSMWKASTPTFVLGTQTPSLSSMVSSIANGDKLIINDGINTATIEFGVNYSTATISDIVNEINTTISSIPVNIRPSVYAEVNGTGIAISNWNGGDLLFSEPVTNSSVGVINALGLANRKGNRLFYSSHTRLPAGSVSGDIWIKTTEPNKGAKNSVKIYSRQTGQWSTLPAPYYSNDDEASVKLGVNVSGGTLYTQYDIYGSNDNPIASTVLKRYNGPNNVVAVGTKIPGLGLSGSSASISNASVSSSAPFLTPGDKFVISAGQLNGTTISAVITVPGPEVDDVVSAINSMSNILTGVTANTNRNGFLEVTNTNKLTLRLDYYNPNTDSFVDNTNTGNPLEDLGIGPSIYTNWTELTYEPSVIEPTTIARDGTLWYDVDFKVDIMVGDGDEWKAYKNVYPDTDPFGAIVAGSAPLTQRDGTPLVDNDIWIDGTDLENYPKMYRWVSSLQEWQLIDNTDQTTPFGVVFADARWSSNGKNDGPREIEDMLISDYCDPDAPDPRTYPQGMLLFNTRFSNYNVKKWDSTYFAEYVGQTVEDGVQYNVGFRQFPEDTITKENQGRWVTESGNKLDGSPYMGRKAQRQVIIRSLASLIVSNQEIRSESVFFNLLCCPGYTELLDEMVTLNVDKKETAFIIADSPARLKPNGTDISAWATNKNNAASNGDDGLITRYTYSAVYYPWGLSTNLDGSEVMVPASSIALRTIGYNDNVAYPWFAPAGFTRGIVTNAVSVGFLNDEGEYEPVILNQGQRDILYLNNINPISFMPQRGLVVFGQKSLHPVSSALDRINVGRLICYLRYNLDIIAKPFLFEQNDKQTRDQVKTVFDRYFENLIGLRAISDFLIICDETNNTNDRIDRNELWIDCLIAPTRVIEFIYIPLRIRNTGGVN